MITTVLICVVLLLISVVAFKSWRSHRYWQDRSVPCPPHMPILGHYQLFFSRRWERVHEMYLKYKSNGFWGVYEFFVPVFYAGDPELVKDITIKDFDHFIDHRTYYLDTSDEYVHDMLFFKTGHSWKGLRSLMTPTFTSGKMKAMFPLIMEKAEEFVHECERLMNEPYIDIFKQSMYYSLDSLASSIFGINANAIQNKEDSSFTKGTRKLFEMDTYGALKFLLLQIAPKFYNLLGFNEKGKYEYLSKVLDKTIEARKESRIKRGDILDTMLESMEDEDNKLDVTIKIIKSQCFGFLFAGFDTSGGILGLSLYQLAKNPEVQQRLREEIQALAETDEGLSYKNIMEAPYLDGVVLEALRVHPPAFMVDRKCTKEYRNEKFGVSLAQGTVVIIPIWSLHFDEEFWDEPHAFKPERFLAENKEKLTPYAYMPFSLGPRNCIAMRFVHMMMKILLAKMVQNFEISLRPGFEEVKMISVVDSIRPDKDGVQIVLNKIN